MRRRRRRGTGEIEHLKDGRHRARIVTQGRRVSLGIYNTEAEAEAVLAAARARLSDVEPGAGLTLGQWATRAFDQRELDGLRSVDDERSRWDAYAADAPIAKLPIRTIERRDVWTWLRGVLARAVTAPAPGKKGARRTRRSKLSRATAQNALTTMRVVLTAAVDAGILESNPAADVALPRDTGRTHEPWTYLAPAEQTALVDAAGKDWPLVAFAIGTGLRQGEQWALRLEDVHLAGDRPHVVVRFGAPGLPTKSGRPRVVQLFGLGLAAAVAQVQRLRTRNARGQLPKNEGGVLFPSRLGCVRSKGSPKVLAAALMAAKIERPVRWHDLRHTCASSLVAGWWGPAWSLEAVRELLGHSTIKVTERYAHLAGTLSERAADATDPLSRGVTRNPTTQSEIVENLRSHLRDLNSRPTVYEGRHEPNEVDEIDARKPRVWGLREAAARALAAANDRDPRAWALLVDVAAEVLAAADGDHASPAMTHHRAPEAKIQANANR